MSAMAYIPVAHTTQYKTDYVQECLVERDNQEIFQKYLQGAQLTEEESKTVTDCVTEKKESDETSKIIRAVIGLVIFLGAGIFLIVSAAKGY